MDITVRGKKGAPLSFFVPPEILRCILEEVDPLGQSRNDILLCCLVCKAWLQESRPILFRHISVDTEWANITSFVHLLRCNPAIARHIQYLELAHIGWIGKHAARVQDTIDRDTFIQMLQALPRLRSLEMDNILLSNATLSKPPLQLTLKRLSVSLSMWEHTQHDSSRFICDILAILHVFSDVEELRLEDIPRSAAVLPRLLIPAHLRLRKLILIAPRTCVSGLLSSLSHMVADLDSSESDLALRSLDVELQARTTLQISRDCSTSPYQDSHTLVSNSIGRKLLPILVSFVCTGCSSTDFGDLFP